jgi:hypothetical protein
MNVPGRLRMPRFGRRQLLGLGASAAVLPFVPWLDREVGAAGPPAKRLVLFTTPNGSILDSWRPQGTEKSFSLSTILEPLAAHKQRMIVLDGVDNTPAALAALGEFSMIGKGHQGAGSLWTQFAAEPGAGETVCDGDSPCQWPAGPSLDQYVASKPQFGGETLFASLTPGVICNGGDRQSRVYYDLDGQPVHPENDPRVLFDMLFSELDLDPAEKQSLRKRRQSVIDVVKGDISALQPKLSMADRHRVDAHLEGVLAIEKKLAGFEGICNAPAEPPEVDIFDNASRPLMTDLQFEIAAHALACDLTRVVSYQWGREGSTGAATWLGQNEGIHTLSHWEGASSVDQAIEWMVDLNRWYAERLAAFLDLLEEKQILDDTLVVWATPLTQGNTHAARNIPLVAFQGSGGYFETNRYLEYGNYQQDKGHVSQKDNNLDHGGQPMTRFCVSILQALGIDDDSFGDPAFGTGALPGL